MSIYEVDEYSENKDDPEDLQESAFQIADLSSNNDSSYAGSGMWICWVNER